MPDSCRRTGAAQVGALATPSREVLRGLPNSARTSVVLTTTKTVASVDVGPLPLRIWLAPKNADTASWSMTASVELERAVGPRLPRLHSGRMKRVR